ncbi:hypothetical protein AB0L35_10050 [Streptomyces sp. NPDC052309]|uniref:hypothetical protein n=1 Tax=Streptomyces sp. NPDC052309 TaxID=3155421 RepID=UPI00344844C6
MRASVDDGGGDRIVLGVDVHIAADGCTTRSGRHRALVLGEDGLQVFGSLGAFVVGEILEEVFDAGPPAFFVTHDRSLRFDLPGLRGCLQLTRGPVETFQLGARALLVSASEPVGHSLAEPGPRVRARCLYDRGASCRGQRGHRLR